MKPLAIWLRSISLALLVASCTPIVDTRGHNLDEADFSQIIPGQSSPDDVRAILGSPSATSTYGDETWYYISERKETSGFNAPEVADQKVVAITFDADKKVADVKDYTKKEGKPVQIVDKETPTEGHELTFIEQMLGNFGRFNTPGRGIDPKTLRR
jgi:outer membrane protein assembly factor BamE (lipoprotein component of BamABCDE complex)